MAVRSTDNNSLFFATGIDNSGLKSGVGDAVGLIQGMASSIGKINPFAALVTAAIAAFAAISTQALEMSRNFEHAMKEVETISSATQKNFKGISQSVFELTKITPDSPEKLANAYYQIVSAGYDGAKGLELLEVSAKAAVAGVTDTTTAADGLTTVLNAFKIDASESENVADALFNTVKLGKTTFSQLSANISQVAPIAAASNIPLNEILATVASLTKQGVPTAQAMTQIRAAIVGLNESGRLDGTKTFQENMQSLYDTFNGNQTAIQKEVGRIEAVQAILAVSGQNAKDAQKDLLAYNTTIGATEEAFNKMASSNVNQWDILTNRIKAKTKGIGDAVLEMSSGLAKSLNDVLEPLDSVIVGFEKERINLLKLESIIKDTNTTNEERITIINELKETYPELLSNIDAETVSNEELTLSIKRVNDQLINKIILARKDAEISEQNETIAEKRIRVLEQEDKVRLQLIKLAEKYNLTIKDGVSLEQQAIDAIKQRRSQQQTQGGRLLDSATELEVQVSQLQTAQKSLNFAESQGTKVLEEKQKLAERLGITLEDNSNKLSEDIQKQIDAINAITREDYKANTNILSKYLNSENEEIRKAAEKRKALLEFKPSVGDEDDRTEIEKFVDGLKKREEEYRTYENYITQLGKEAADKRFTALLKEGEDYGSFLQSQLEKFKENEAKKDAIVNAASQAGVGLTPREILQPIEIQKVGIKLDIDFDTTSFNAIDRRIQKLYSDLDKARTDAERKLINQKIEAEEEKLRAAFNASRTELQIHRDEVVNFANLTNSKLKLEIDYWRKRLNTVEKGSETAIEAEQNIRNAQAQIGQNTSQVISQITGTLNESAELFRKFGEEDIAQLLDQLAGVAEGVGRIASGDIIGGSLAILNSALTVEVVSDTSKFEEAIQALEKAIDKLDYVISQSVGRDRITSRIDAISDLQELEQQAQAAQQAEREARREVRFLGVRIGRKGRGSGTDQAKLEDLEQKAEEARQKAEELRQQLDELYTGTTEQTIVDSIISGLKEGKRSVEDFADNFKDLMQDALLQAFQIKYLEKEIEKFYDAFAEAGSDSNYSASEIEALRELYNQMIAGAQDDLDAINQILEETGIGSLGDNSEQTGLAAGIKPITEDTANILAGTLNSIRIDVANSIEIAEQCSSYLAQIVQNTSYNHFLESMDNRLNNIETLLSRS